MSLTFKSLIQMHFQNEECIFKMKKHFKLDFKIFVLFFLIFGNFCHLEYILTFLKLHRLNFH